MHSLWCHVQHSSGTGDPKSSLFSAFFSFATFTQATSRDFHLIKVTKKKLFHRRARKFNLILKNFCCCLTWAHSSSSHKQTQALAVEEEKRSWEEENNEEKFRFAIIRKSDETKQIFAKSLSHNLLRTDEERKKKLFRKFIPFLLSFERLFFQGNRDLSRTTIPISISK